ncbi:MAG: helix-turn-helix domain-containing protein, partial [Verrucomicrobiae bacterium]|nr:helix-turn-helix domain-containing protein [Verrucomicrobiae bacterium]
LRNPEGTCFINDRCLFRTREGLRVVIVSGIVLAQYTVADRMAEAYAMVSLVEQGWADQNEVARAFGCSTRTLRRHQRRFEAGGLNSLGHAAGYPRGRPRLARSHEAGVQRLHTQGRSARDIARQMGVSEKAIRKLLRRLGLQGTPRPEPELDLTSSAPADPNLSASLIHAIPEASSRADPNVSAFGESSLAPTSADTDPNDRRHDRLLAYLGLLDDAPPLFGSRLAVPRAGVLLAVPALVHSGVFECAHQIYGSLGPAFYGLRTSMLTLLLMALWRIKRPEALKEHSPKDLGAVLGLDRAPEVKTLRRKLTGLAKARRAADFGQALAQRRVEARGANLGFLYLDGHVRVYHGKHPLPKTHVARMRLSMPATTDYWVNDPGSDPLFVVTAAANAGLVKMLPGLLQQIRGLIGDRRLTIVFDRGGYSPKLFGQILEAGFDLLTYRKGRFRRIPRQRFQRRHFRLAGRTHTYLLADQEVRLLKGKLRLRQVTRLSDNGHQTPILTSRRDLPSAQVAYRMFERWRQENFFKYGREEYALDALADYATEPDDPDREVPNPAWVAVDRQLRQAWAQVERLQAEYGLEAILTLDSDRPSLRAFKQAHGLIGEKIWRAMKKVLELQQRRASLPRRVPVHAASDEPVVKLAPERKHLMNLIKMLAYQAESDLLQALAPHYRRVQDEGRTLIQSALASVADLKVTATELCITLAPLSSLHRSRAVAALCRELNETNTCFPGSRLRMSFAVSGVL